MFDYQHNLPEEFECRRQETSLKRKQTLNDAFDALITSSPLINGDEKRYEQLGLPGFASFTKALAHNSIGLVEQSSYESLLMAIQQGSQSAFEEVQLGGGKRLLTNPLNAYSFQLIGNDSHGARIAVAPEFASRNTAIDMVERYWMALSRDLRFDQYANSRLIADACEDLNNLGFEREFGFECSPETIFRGPYEGCDIGPHVSQFLLRDFQFGNQPIQQLQRYPREGLDYLTDFETWNQVNNGQINPTGSDIIDGTRYITTLRDGGQWVHLDFPHQSGLWATIILLGLKANISEASPYASEDITSSEAFGSLGGSDITVQSSLAGVYALKHAWFQKWVVHRRLRPEVYAQRLELCRRGELGQPDNPLNNDKFDGLFGSGADVWRKTSVLDRILEHNQQQNKAQSRGDQNGTWLLPMAFPEGSPTHPAYPGGHATFVAAAATIAKAFFADGEFFNPKVPIDQGQQLGDYQGPTLTVHGELNKLIANVTLFRDGAGVHWRTDGTASGLNAAFDRQGNGIETGGNLLGEKMAISMLRDIKRTYRENVGTFEFRDLGGNLVQI
ncbi:hypothetical protein [Pleurocapsa sp. CCALA 161]|uniref:hypothetical protein n=1 Tax=Pleurocapsa sp. CCALA 161 TaxID=2107688 RepID=UPI0018EBB062|nr:hypothetical protein [Pleurocapsa sp. CCALA 161]